MKNDNVVSFKGIKKNNLPYIFIWVGYYAWLVAFATRQTSSLLNNIVSISSLMNIVNLFSSAIFIMIIKKEWFSKMARVGAVSIIAVTAVFFTVPSAPVQLLCAGIMGVSLGRLNISILLPFVFTLNNTEKLYAVVGCNTLIGLISLFKGVNSGNNSRSILDLLLFVTLLILVLSVIFFLNKNSIPVDSDNNDKNIPKIPSRVYLTLVFNCLFVIVIKGVGSGILNIAANSPDSPVLLWYAIGGLTGCLVYFALYAFIQKAFIWLGNISFAFVAMGLLCNAFTVQIPRMSAMFAFLLGIGGTVGMINMFYIIGVVGKKYNSMRYLRLSVLIIGFCGGISGLAVGNLIQSINTFEISIIASIISVSIMLLFMMLSPTLVQEHYYSDWARDSEKTEIDNDQLYMFKKYQLSKREIEVCKLLLQGYTLRQISAILSIAYSTVNTYCTCVYRKLSINSRTELLILFKDYAIK